MTTIAFPSICTSARLPSGVNYSYVHIKPLTNRPYILFLHGFPSSSYDWRKQIPFFSELGYGIIVPDLLGYGATDKPEEVEAYQLKKMSQDVVSILDIENTGKVYGVGHDWGSFLLSRLANYFPDRFLKFAWLDVAYQAPVGLFDVGALNALSEKMMGYPAFSYWDFFTDEDTADLMDRNADCTGSLWYAGDPTNLTEVLCNIDATRSWFAEGKSAPLASWISDEEFQTHKKIFNPSNGGLGPPLKWYKAQAANLNTQDESTILPENLNVQQRSLLITCSKDYIAAPAMQEEVMRPYVKNLRVETVETGHWLQLEKPGEVNAILQSFFEEADEV